MPKKIACGCREPKTHRDCAYCGVTSHSNGKVCGVCTEAGIDGGTIRGTERRTCAKHLAVTFVTIGPNVWGKGKTVSEAVKNAKDELFHRGRINLRTFRVVGFNYVSDMGAINYNSKGSCEVVDEVTFMRR